MKTLKLLVVFVVMFAMSLPAAQILWVGVADNATVHVDGNNYTVARWANAIGQDMVNVGGRILVNGTPMLAGYEDPSGYIPAGQTAPSIVWDDDITDFMIAVVNQYDEPTGRYADWQPINLGDEDLADKSAQVVFQLGYWDDDGWGDFVPLVYASDVLGNLWDLHTYTTGSLAPPNETPWKPVDFYGSTPIPEPSITILMSIGFGAILLRKHV